MKIGQLLVASAHVFLILCFESRLFQRVPSLLVAETCAVVVFRDSADQTGPARLDSKCCRGLLEAMEQ